jgi:hypothetical protein
VPHALHTSPRQRPPLAAAPAAPCLPRRLPLSALRVPMLPACEDAAAGRASCLLLPLGLLSTDAGHELLPGLGPGRRTAAALLPMALLLLLALPPPPLALPPPAALAPEARHNEPLLLLQLASDSGPLSTDSASSPAAASPAAGAKGSRCHDSWLHVSSSAPCGCPHPKLRCDPATWAAAAAARRSACCCSALQRLPPLAALRAVPGLLPARLLPLLPLLLLPPASGE